MNSKNESILIDKPIEFWVEDLLLTYPTNNLINIYLSNIYSIAFLFSCSFFICKHFFKIICLADYLFKYNLNRN